MKRIDKDVGAAYLGALQCVEFRVPTQGGLKSPAYLLSVALRYGLVGAAATHHLLLEADSETEVQQILDAAARWPDMVEEHLVQFVAAKLPVAISPQMPYMIGRLSYRPLSAAISEFEFFTPIGHTLRAIATRFSKDYRRAMFVRCPLWQRRKTLAEFSTLSEKSVYYAINFFERRQASLDEVAEIALIGE